MAVTPEEALLIRKLIANDDASLAHLQASKPTAEEAIQAARISLEAAEVSVAEARLASVSIAPLGAATFLSQWSSYKEEELDLILEYMRSCTDIKTLPLGGDTVERVMAALGDRPGALLSISELNVFSYGVSIETIERHLTTACRVDRDRRYEGDGMDIDTPSIDTANMVTPFSQITLISFTDCPLITPEMEKTLSEVLCYYTGYSVESGVIQTT
ncbi:hypothetical protein PIIN_06169 [Serendipita indica DSM 11827]|uniref:Uncharacterized protein n=1 Tax=Serendipita indica (strain DSM 11827) TaxID=1109443 RepID=G4TLQ2_SERID|nr:hypothetical protein PIIN_06169 [Serendipita indica DSM 11827]